MSGKTHLLKTGNIVALCILCLTFSFGATLPALAAKQGTGSDTHIQAGKAVSHTVSSQEGLSKAQSYWTADRMRNAIPVEATLHVIAHAPHQVAPSNGKSASAAPVAPRGQVTEKAPAHPGVKPDAYQLPHWAYGYYPYSTIGKVFFTDSRTGYNYVCSGTAVNSNNKSVVDTAGHCVVQGGSGNNWYTNWAFCPQYYYGCQANKLWYARQLWSYSYWSNNGWFEEDYGDAVMWSNNVGYLVNVVGGTGWAYNYSYYQYFYAFGYPAAYPFDGNTMWYCPSSFQGYDFPSPGNAPAMKIYCDMTGGSSGGGWLISINNTFGYVNGHNDYKYNNDSTHMFSPYYGNDWFAVFNSAQNS